MTASRPRSTVHRVRSRPRRSRAEVQIVMLVKRRDVGEVAPLQVTQLDRAPPALVLEVQRRVAVPELELLVEPVRVSGVTDRDDEPSCMTVRAADVEVRLHHQHALVEATDRAAMRIVDWAADAAPTRLARAPVVELVVQMRGQRNARRLRRQRCREG